MNATWLLRHCRPARSRRFRLRRAEWKAIKGQRAKQPYAIAMKDGSPFGIAGLWENRKDPASGELRLSPPMLTSWWPKSMTVCPRSSCRRLLRKRLNCCVAVQ